MTLELEAVEIDITPPGSDSPTATIPDEVIGSITIGERINDRMDNCSISFDNTMAGSGWGESKWGVGSWSGPTNINEITTGDRIDIKTQLRGESSLVREWTGIVRNPTDTIEGGNVALREVDATDFVFTVLSFRRTFENFENKPIAGSSDAILDTVIDREAPEIDRSGIVEVDDVADMFADGKTLFSIVVGDLRSEADAVVAQDGDTLIFEPLTNVSADTTLTQDDFYAGIEIDRNDQDLVNNVRVTGGRDHASDDEQTTQSTTQRVTDSNRVVQQLQTRKSEIDRFQLYTKRDANSDDNLRVRIQAERNGSPVAIGDQNSDIARKSLEAELIADDGYTEFVLPRHTLGGSEPPFVIIESNGSTGHDIGTDGNGTPTYRAEYPFDLVAQILDESSQQQYRRRDTRIEDDALRTERAVKTRAQTELRRNNRPALTVSAEAQTPTAHRLSAGDAVTLSGFDRFDVDTTYIVSERSVDIAGGLLNTSLTLQDTKTV